MLYRILGIIAAALLLIGVADLPYGYYTFLRVSVFLIAGFGTMQAAGEGAVGWTVLLAGVAVLFNPIIPIYLDRSTWAVLDVVAAVIVFASAFQVGGSSQEYQPSH